MVRNHPYTAETNRIQIFQYTHLKKEIYYMCIRGLYYIKGSRTIFHHQIGSIASYQLVYVLPCMMQE